MKPIGYKFIPRAKEREQLMQKEDSDWADGPQVELEVEITNEGLSDQIHDDIRLEIMNVNF